MPAQTLAPMRRQLREMRSPQTLQRVNQIAGETAAGLIQRGFDRARDPYGVPWAPTKQRNPILRRTGLLRRSIAWLATSGGVRFSVTGRAALYGRVHQRGGRHIKARRFLPDPQRGLPPEFERAMRARAEAYFKRRWR